MNVRLDVEYDPRHQGIALVARANGGRFELAMSHALAIALGEELERFRWYAPGDLPLAEQPAVPGFVDGAVEISRTVIQKVGAADPQARIWLRLRQSAGLGDPPLGLDTPIEAVLRLDDREVTFPEGERRCLGVFIPTSVFSDVGPPAPTEGEGGFPGDGDHDACRPAAQPSVAGRALPSVEVDGNDNDRGVRASVRFAASRGSGPLETEVDGRHERGTRAAVADELRGADAPYHRAATGSCHIEASVAGLDNPTVRRPVGCGNAAGGVAP